MVERRGQVLAEQAIGEEQAGYDRQSGPHDQPRAGKDRDQRDDAEDDIGGEREAGAKDQRLVFDMLVECDGDCGCGQTPGQRLEWRFPAMCGCDQRKGEQQQQADMEGADDLARQDEQVRGSRDLEQRKSDRDPEQHPPLEARLETGLCRVMQRDVDRRRFFGLRHGRPLRKEPEGRDGRNLDGFATVRVGLDLTSGPFPCNSALRRDAAAPECPSARSPG